MTYKIPDGWPLPDEITWYSCNRCGMLYGDGEITQALLNDYYKGFYGYGVNSPDNVRRLKYDARSHAVRYKLDNSSRVLDFGGAGDDGESVFIAELKKYFNLVDGYCTSAGDDLPLDCDVIFASHVLEHIYDLPETMDKLVNSLAPDGMLVIDGPDAANINPDWPILDFNTKHLNHFTLKDYTRLGWVYGMEVIAARTYELAGYPCYQLAFKRIGVALQSAYHVKQNVEDRLEKLRAIDYPVNVWGLADVTWHLLSKVDLDVLGYIDNDPAYKGKRFDGRMVLDSPRNDAPIVVMAQGQRERLIMHIKSVCKNRIIEI